jgi:predicted phosphoribosyltransferase
MYSSRAFENRKDAGTKLGVFLEPKYKQFDPLIIGIPRGGVEVAYYVAQQLKAELSVIVSKKLPFPGQPEYGFGAVSEEGSVYVSERRRERLSENVVDQIIEEQQKEVKTRVLKYRGGKPLPEMKGRTVILVDDGIATGVTLVPVVELCRKKGAAKIIIAAPVSGLNYDEHLEEADAIEVLIQPTSFYAVGQVYEEFGDFGDQQLIELLAMSKDWRK